MLPTADPADGALTYWGVDDVAAAIAHAIELGAVEHVPATEVGDGIVTGTVRTPDGAILGPDLQPAFPRYLTNWPIAMAANNNVR